MAHDGLYPRCHFHVADSNRWHPSAGHLDFMSILRALAETGYQGWVSGEFLPLPHAVTLPQWVSWDVAREGLAILRLL